MSRRDPVDRELRALGFELVRAKRHRVYRHPGGGQVVAAATPSDPRSERNTIAQARRIARGT